MGVFQVKQEDRDAPADRSQEVATEYVPSIFDMDQRNEWLSYMERKNGDVVGSESDGGRAGSLEVMNYFFSAVDAARAVHDLADPDASVPDKIKAGVGLGSEAVSLVPGLGHIAPAVSAGAQFYDETVAGSQWLKEQGFFGQRGGENRGAVEASSDFASAFSAPLQWDSGGVSEGDGGFMQDLIAWPAAMASGTVTGLASAAVGSARVVAETLRPIGMFDPEFRAAGLEYVAREERINKEFAKRAEADGIAEAFLAVHGHMTD